MGRAKEVDDWFKRYDNPMKAVAMRMRDIILDVDPRVGECIKWQAPTFTFEGNIASFFPKSKKHASLMFHQGAKIPGRHPILEGGGETGRFVKIGSIEEADRRSQELGDVIRAWIAFKCTEAPEGTRKPGATNNKVCAPTSKGSPAKKKKAAPKKRASC